MTTAEEYRLFKIILSLHPEIRLSYNEFLKKFMPFFRKRKSSVSRPSEVLREAVVQAAIRIRNGIHKDSWDALASSVDALAQSAAGTSQEPKG